MASLRADSRGVIVVCASCAQANRLAFGRLGLATRCGQWLVVKVDTEGVPDLAARLRIQSIPTMAVFRDGALAARTSGAMPADQIEAFVQQSLSA